MVCPGKFAVGIDSIKPTSTGQCRDSKLVQYSPFVAYIRNNCSRAYYVPPIYLNYHPLRRQWWWPNRLLRLDDSGRANCSPYIVELKFQKSAASNADANWAIFISPYFQFIFFCSTTIQTFPLFVIGGWVDFHPKSWMPLNTGYIGKVVKCKIRR